MTHSGTYDTGLTKLFMPHSTFHIHPGTKLTWLGCKERNPQTHQPTKAGIGEKNLKYKEFRGGGGINTIVSSPNL